MRTLEDIVGHPNPTPYEISKITAKSIFDFEYFVKKVLGFNQPFDLSDFHNESMNKVTSERFAVMIWARGHLKTTIWSVAYPIWRLWKETNFKIGVVSSAVDQSMKSIAEVQHTIQDNEFLRKLMPEGRKDTWNKSQLNTTNGNKYLLRPFSDSARGEHFDVLVMDDILRQEDTTQEDIIRKFNGIFVPMVQTRGGQLIVVGTPMTNMDLLNTLYKNDKWFGLKYPAVITDDKGTWIKPNWDKRFTLEELEKIKEQMGPLMWQREYMCNPMAAGSSIFKDIRIGKHSSITEPKSGMIYYLGVDIAMSEAKGTDYSVFCVIERDGDGFMRQVKQERYGPKDKIRTEATLMERINELHQDFNFRKIYVEDRGLSKGLVKTLTSKELNPISWSVLEGYRTGRTGVHSKEALISRTATAFSRDELEVLENQILIDELMAFKIKENRRTRGSTYEGVGEHDDCVIALCLAVMAATDKIGRASVSFI